MKLKNMLLAGVLMMGAVGVQAASIPAFPGAEGYGAYATGGRGGDVYVVTSLNNSGAGTLRDALNTVPAAGRTIVFAVSGYIPVVSDTNFQVPNNVTIAGQTAPGDGIGLKGGRMLIKGNNTIMRHFRIRHGKSGTGGDCLNIDKGVETTMLDHIGLMFSTDENFSFFGTAPNNFTMQYSTSTWGMERHNAGGLWDLNHGTCHHTLWAHHRTRNPKSRPTGMLEWINNVTYHWRNEGYIMGDTQSNVDYYSNIIGCYYISIADFGKSLDSTPLSKAQLRDSDGKPNFHLYLDDTLIDCDGDGVLNGVDNGRSIASGSPDFSDTPFAGASAAVTTDDPLTAYKKVISASGPLRLDASADSLRDELDSLLIDSVTNQYSVLVAKDSPVTTDPEEPPSNGEQHLADVYGISNNGFGTLAPSVARTDSDEDGMPDDWEMALGFNVGVQNHNTLFGNNGSIITESTFFPENTPAGYTHLEEYLHFCAIPHAWISKNTPEQPSSFMVDLRRYTSGFTDAPSFIISNVSGGRVQQDGSVVTFTPTENYYGRAGFDFTVSDADGSSWTQQFAMLVTISAEPRELVWIGGNNGNVWDTESANWQNASGATTLFSVGDCAVFDDRGTATSITVSRNLSAMAMTVAGSSSYSFSGAGAVNVIDVFTNMASGTLTLNTPIGAGSGALLNGGETVLNAGGNITGGEIELADGATLTDNTGATGLGLSSGFRVASGETGNINLSSQVDVGGALSGSGTLNLGVNSTGDYFTSDCSGFAGQLNVSARTGADELRINLGYGSGLQLGSGKLYLGDGVVMHQTANGPPDDPWGTPHYIGELSGAAGAQIGAQPIGGRYCTWTIGALNTDSTFAGTIRDSDYLDAWNGRGTANLSKVGSGTLTLSGNNTYSGNTAIYGGELKVTGSLGDTDVYIGSGAKFSGSGAMGRLLSILTGSEVDVGNAAGTVGTMTTSGGITLKAGTLYFDLSSNPSSGNDQIVNRSGTLTFDGTDGAAHFVFNLIDGALSEGTYTLITGGSATAAPNSPAFTHNLVNSENQVYTLQRSAGGSSDAYVRLVVTNLDPEPPPTPTGVTVSAGNTQVTVSWDAVPGASSYILKRATFSDGAYVTVGTSTSTEFVDTGLSNLTTYYYVVVAVNSYGESAESTSLGAMPEIGSLQLNSGGDAVSPYTADAYYSGGGIWSTSTSVSTSDVTDPAPASTYQTERNGNFTYTIPGLEPGENYQVRLHFAEIYHTSSEARVFDVSINGSVVLDNFDIYAQTGARYQALVREFTVPADSNGEIEVDFVTVTDNAKVSAIEIQNAPNAPKILVQPVGRSAVVGGSATFSVVASGTPLPEYIWMKDGVELTDETTSTLTLSDAQSSDQGMYSVAVYNAEGCVISTNVALVVGSVSGAPTGLLATPGNHQVELNWYDSTNALEYVVKRALSSGGSYRTIATVSGTSFTDLYALNDTTYYYVVTAISASGALDSAEVSATPTAESAGITIQVEDATVTYGGGVTMDSNNDGFHVSGFVNFPTTDGYVQFNQVPGGTGGDAVLVFRFALGNTARTGTISVNGVESSITFPGTGAWTTWTTMSFPVTLNAGNANVIRIESTGSDLSNLDEMTVIPTVVHVPVVEPVVSVDYDEGSVFVTWPYAYTGWLLQYSTNLTSGAGWVDIVNSVELDSITIPAAAVPWNSMFFRLVSPE